MERNAVYAGTFDPPTYGHLWLIEKAASLFDILHVVISDNAEKAYTYSLDMRVKMLKTITGHLRNVSIEVFASGFLADYAMDIGADYLVRGMRTIKDYEYERIIRQINTDIAPSLLSVFLMPPREYAEISSSLVRGLIGFNRWEEVIKPYVPEPIRKLMIEEFYKHEH